MDKKLMDIGHSNQLDEKELGDFVIFFKKRFPHYVRKDYVNEGYADQWAHRFSIGTEWSAADTDSRKVLMEINSKKYHGLGDHDYSKKHRWL